MTVTAVNSLRAGVCRFVAALALLLACPALVCAAAESTPQGIPAPADLPWLRSAPEGTRIILVAGNGEQPGARLAAYEREKSGWVLRISAPARTGFTGIRVDRKEGSGATPAGIYTFGRAFGTATDPGSLTPYTVTDEHDLWVDDPASKHYNQWVRTDETASDWRSAERLSEYTVAYKYAIAINFNNAPVVPGVGSAIFLHCFDKPVTLGCLSVSEQDMIRLLQFIDSKTRIAIAPTGADLPSVDSIRK